MKLFIKYIIIISLISTALISSFHSNYLFLNFKEKIAPKILFYLRFDPYKSTIFIAEKLDLKKFYLSIKHPLKNSDIVNLKLAENDFNDIISKKTEWIDASILIYDTIYPLKIKLHGKSAVHFSDNKFSFRLKSQKGMKNVLGMKDFNLIKAEDADPTIFAANKIAKEFGLFSSYGRWVQLRINDNNIGLYYLVERISKSFLKKNFKITKHSKLSQIDDWSRKESSSATLHASDFDLTVQHIKDKETKVHRKALRKFNEMLQALKSSDHSKFIKFYDIKYMGKFLAMASLFNDAHFLVGDNLKFIYDDKSCKFFPIYRQEEGSKFLNEGFYVQEDFKFNNFNNYNQLLFNKSVPKYKNTKTFVILKTLLSNNEVRNFRDSILYSVTSKKEEYINKLKNVYKENERLLYNSDFSRREQNLRMDKQIKVFLKTTGFARKYLTYTHIYSSYYLDSGKIELFADSYSNLRIVSNGEYDSNFNGIEFSEELDKTYNTLSFKTKNPSEIIYINNVTLDTIKHDKIYLNYIK